MVRNLFPKYFALKPSTDEAARVAMRVYADTIREADPDLAKEIDEWLADIALELANQVQK